MNLYYIEVSLYLNTDLGQYSMVKLEFDGMPTLPLRQNTDKISLLLKH